ncbi:HAD family hydrolase [Chitinophaga sp. Hz27]|uniref:HAD family hydrolase n=1 Tax=Chitinophaga sp. Hz27 TaxID=3347169 RepID=UPI0035D627CF
MGKETIKYILFDAANTLIHKPQLWTKMDAAFQKFGIEVDMKRLQTNHKLLSEVIEFPDKTSADFYRKFNADLLLSLGIIPEEELLNCIFEYCTYLPWEKFEDTNVLDKLNVPVGVVSNFNNGLSGILNGLFGNRFQDIIVSEEKKLRKPDLAFYQLAQDAVGLKPDEILYIGDSLSLDIIPGKQMGWRVLLIDRLELFTAGGLSISSLNALSEIV